MRSEGQRDREAASVVGWAANAARGVPRQVVADLALLLVTAIWGGTFVMVKDAVTGYPVFSFLAIRFTFASLAFVPVLWSTRRDAAGDSAPSGLIVRSSRVPFLRAPAAVLLGLALFAGYGFQTLGLRLTTPAKTGFITGLYVVIVPLIAALWLREAPRRVVWLGAALATCGLALLSWQPDQGISRGDILVLGCAVAFAIQILLTERFAPRVDPLWLAFGEIATAAVLCAGAALLWETRPPLTWPLLAAAAFTGLFATAAAFGIQTTAQRFTTATHTALIFAAEPVFAALFSFVLIGEALGAPQLLGCALILSGMIIAELLG